MSFGQRIRHRVETVKGSAKRVTGRITGNRRLEGEGRTEEAKGNMKQAADKVRNTVKP